MSLAADRVKQWRIRTKQRMIDAFGGKCCVCGYNRSPRALDFHHRNPADKDFAFGAVRTSPKAWSEIVIELRKCVLVCNRCHAEIHDGLVQIPDNAPSFDEKFCTYENPRKTMLHDSCPVCGKEKIITNRTCSWVCAGKLHGKVNWDEIDLKELRKEKSFVEIAEMLDISEAAVRKRWKKIMS